MGRNAIPPLDIPPSLPYNHSMDVFEEQLRQKFARFEKLLADTGKIRLAIQENENKLLSIVDAPRPRTRASPPMMAHPCTASGPCCKTSRRWPTTSPSPTSTPRPTALAIESMDLNELAT